MNPGSVVGSYEILSEIGAGGFSTIFKARHRTAGTEHALKVLAPHLAQDNDVRARFLSEGEIQHRITHPNIVRVTETLTEPSPILVMGFVDGPDLVAYQDGRALGTREVLDLMLPVLDALGAVHKAGVVHRDLKPENILVARGPDGRPRPMVTDFGIAKILDEASISRGRPKTALGIKMGTMSYMSPEQANGESVDARSDIFTLGAMTYELATGELAFDGKNPGDVIRAILSGGYRPLPPPKPPGPEVPAAENAVIQEALARAMKVKAADRFQDCAAFAAALAEADPTRKAVPAVSSRLWLGVAAALGVLLLGAVALAVLIGALVLGGALVWIGSF